MNNITKSLCRECIALENLNILRLIEEVRLMRDNDAYKLVAVFEGRYSTTTGGIAAPLLKPPKEFGVVKSYCEPQ